jgi:hypothetical protein
VEATGIIDAVATKKQKRRREKEHRHEYEIVYVDDEGNEVEPDEPEVRGPARRTTSSASKSTRSSGGSARGGRGKAPQPPSWRRVIKRGAIFAPLFLATLLLLGRGHTDYPSAIGQTVILIGLFVPFSYFLDSMLWRSYLKKTGQSSSAKR